MNNDQKSIDIKLKVDNSDVEKSFKEVEKSSIKMANNVSKNSKKANDTMVKDTQKATSKLNNQFKDLQKQMNKALDATKLSSKLSNSLSKIKAQLNSALGNIQLDVQLNASNTGTSGGVASALAGVGAGIASSGAVGASLQKSLSQAHKASQGLVENTKRTQKHLKEAVSQNKDFNKEMKSILKNADEIDDVSFQQMISGVHELDKLSKTMKGFRKNLDFTEIMNANNMKLGEADKLVNDLIVLFTHLNGVLNTENGVGAYINQIERLEQVQSALNKQKRGLKYGDKLISSESLQTIKQATVVANTATKPMARFRVVLEEIGQSKAMTKIGHGWTKLATSFKTHAPKITGAIDKIKTKTSQWLSNHTKTAKGIEKANKGVGNSFKSLLKSIMPFVSAFAIFNTLKKSINDAMESIETDNMFNTVFGSSSQEMNKWVGEVNKTLGLGITNTKQYTATINQMGRAMGLTGEQAKDMSQKMALMAGDISSFYDIDIANVQADLRSALSSSYETMDKYGIVLRASTIQQFAYANGIAKTGSELTNAQRAMATTMMIEQQLGLANGDLARSLDSPANQARILRSNLADLSVALGKCFMPIVTVVLPILNTFVKSLTTTINAIANFISQVFALFGVSVDFGIGGAVDDMASSIESADVGSGGLSDNLASGAESAKEIQKFLAGIDELNIVSTKQDSGSGGSGSGGSGSTGGIGGGAIDTGAIDNGLAQVETKFSKWAEKVASALKSVWGSLKDGWNSVGDYISSSLGKLKQSFSNLGQSIESFLIGAWNNGGKELVYNIGRLAGAVTGLALDISSQVVDAVAKLFDHLNPDSNPYTRKFIEAMNNALVACQNFALSAGAWLSTFMSSGGQAFLNVMGDIVMLLGTTLVNAFANCINWITAFMNSWAGQTILKVVAVSLDVLAGALKLVMIAVEKLTPVWSSLLTLMGAKATFDMVQKALALTTKKLVDFGLKVATNIENLVVWSKGVIKLATTFSKNLVKGLASATKGAVSFGVAMLKNAGKALASGIASISAYTAGLIGLDGALVASTFAAGGLKIALDLLGIGLIVTAVIALVTAVIKIGNKFNWWSNIANWLSEKLGWVVDGVKKFFGWTGDNNVSEEFDDTTDSIEGMGDAFEETTDEIETTADRFGTVASKVNQHFASIGFDAGKLANDLSEAEAMMNEKFGMMSKNAQEYLDALATGNQEVLTQMSADSESYTQEILYSYQKLSENEKNTFYETYGYIKGINDDWLNYSGLTYEQLMAKHASYSANIMKDEDLTAQEKDKLIDEHLTKVNLAYEEELTALKKQKKEILNNSKLSDEERQRLLEDVNAKIITKEQEKTGKVIDEIESVTDAQEKSSKAQQESVKDATDAQVQSLKDVDKSLNDTKKTLSSFKVESDKIANNIPKAWSGVGKKISKEFSDAKMSIANSMSSLLTTVQANVNKIKNSMSGMTTGISTDFNKSLNTLSNNIDAKFKSMVSNIQSFAKQMRNAMNFNFPTPYLKMPHLSVTGKWDFEKQQVPKFKVNWYSSGGIFPTRTLIGVGDANKGVGNNPEAVLPLNVLWKELNNNFDKQNRAIAKMVTNSNQPIFLSLNIDGDTLAKKQFKSFKELAQLGIIDFSELV